MTSSIAVVGDIHGNSAALRGLLKTLTISRFSKLVFVGDYVNRGPDSHGVVETLMDLGRDDEDVVFLAGNHDRAFLECLQTGNVNRFLRMGGAATIASYVGTPQPDVLRQLRRVVPATHVEFLEALSLDFRLGDELLVTHDIRDEEITHARPSWFHIYGHAAQLDLKPRITSSRAAIDTGCGTVVGGRLTCLHWPTLEFQQVDEAGNPVAP